MSIHSSDREAWLALRNANGSLPRSRGKPVDLAWFKSRTMPAASGCWLWLGGLTTSGYGSVNKNGLTNQAHRLSYETLVGPIPDGRHVLHTCDVRECCNPGHLMLGDNDENVRQRVARGRSASASGEKNPRAKLYGDEADEIVLMLKSGMKRKEAARAVGVSRSTVTKCARRNGVPDGKDCKLLEGNVRVIRMLLSLPRSERPSQKEIAGVFGVEQTAVSAISRRLTWRSV